MKKLYCFDFDGTLTDKDTMFLFLRFYNRSRYRIQFLKHIPLFVLLKCKLLEAEKVKKSFIKGVLGGQSQHQIEAKAQAFFKEFFPGIMRPAALDFLQNRDKNSTTSLLVTASLDIWVKPFAEHFNLQLLATQAAFENGVFKGGFSSRNCNGPEKVSRIKEAIEGQKFDKIIAFGDTSGDREMLAFADESHYRFFH